MWLICLKYLEKMGYIRIIKKRDLRSKAFNLSKPSSNFY